MKVLVIPDIHLKPWIFDRAEEIMKAGKAERAVCLMDLPDDWNMGFQISLYEETFDRAIAWVKAYPDTLWCYGNHDVSYPWRKDETGYSTYAEHTVVMKLRELEEELPRLSQIAIIHRIDKVLFMHGGLTDIFVRWQGDEFMKADIDEVIAMINDASRSDLWRNNSPLWFRPQYDKAKIFRAKEYKQVVGHTPVEKIYEENGVISTDVFSTKPNGEQIGESAMIVIDTETGEYEKIPVEGKPE
ncbi:MAG: metallophosphoesterase [Clostridiales bacterium]|nr:metallophosphoesterase [Clostridiales bacterium]